MGQGKMKRIRTPTKDVIEEQETSSKTSDEENASRIPLTQTRIVIEATKPMSVSGWQLFVLKCVAITSTFMSVILLSIVIILAHHLGAIQYCFPGDTTIPRDLENPGVFEDMTPREFASVRDYMLHTSNIGLVPIEAATVNSSYIFMIDLHIPLKSAVLEYLDIGSVRLTRAAKVVIVRGDLESPRVEEYLVSPLPIPTTHRLARNPSYTRFPIPYESRPTDQVDYKYLFPIITKFSEQVYHILKESYGLSYHNCTPRVDCILFYDVAPRGRQSGDRKSWFWSFRDVEGFYLHPLGLEIQIDHKSTDVSEWRIDKIVYNGHLMYTVTDLLDMYQSMARQPKWKIKMDRPVGRSDELFSSYHRRGPSEMPIPKQGPKLVEPDGHRYSLTGQHVKYMHWDFDIRMRPSTGIQIFDVRFQSDRIAYELSLQDAVVFYSGFGPTQSMSNFYGTSWMMGASSFELVRGVDCPDTASFMSADHFVNSGKSRHYRNTVCIFEQNPGIPLRRHYANNFKDGYTNYGGIVDYQLVVRNIANIWNYDYIFDYVFHLNGHVEVRVSTTGYVQATYQLPFERPYGNPIFFDTMANLHQQLFHYKVDLDIGKKGNSYSLLEVDTETVRHPWYPNTNKTQMSFSEKKMKREMDSVVDDSDNPRYHIIYGDSEFVNKYNTQRGYRILNKAETKFLIPDVPVTKAAQWAKYPLVVTKYDDTEDQSSSIYAQNDPWDPIVDFERFVSDNDTIENEDLIAWLTLGAHHIPHTEDVPSTPTSWNQYTFHLMPFNFFTECPSVSSPNMVHIRPDNNYEHINVNTFGTSFESTCAQISYGPNTYYGYRGDD